MLVYLFTLPQASYQKKSHLRTNKKSRGASKTMPVDATGNTKTIYLTILSIPKNAIPQTALNDDQHVYKQTALTALFASCQKTSG